LLLHLGKQNPEFLPLVGHYQILAEVIPADLADPGIRVRVHIADGETDSGGSKPCSPFALNEMPTYFEASYTPSQPTPLYCP